MSTVMPDSNSNMHPDYRAQPFVIPKSNSSIHYDYELPSTIDSLRQGWISSCQSAAVVSGLFASTAAQLLSSVKSVSETDANTKYPYAVSAMLICAYAVLVFASSATITSLILTDKLGGMPVRASKRGAPPRASDSVRKGNLRSTEQNELELLQEYGIGRSWTFIMWHWFISLIVGIFLMMVEIVLYVFLAGERNSVKYVTLVIVIFAVLPLISFVPFKLKRP